MIGEAANDPGVLMFFHAKNGGFFTTPRVWKNIRKKSQMGSFTQVSG